MRRQDRARAGRRAEDSIKRRSAGIYKIEPQRTYNEAISALQVLGYSKKEIEKALQGINEELTVEEIIKLGLKNLAR